MTFVLIKGTFHVQGYRLDGDSIRFRADDPVYWKKLSGPPVALNALGHAHIRMEAVDALETNFQGFHQPLRLARPAVRYLLSSLGIQDVVWDEAQRRVIKAEDGKNGENGKDGKKGQRVHPGPQYSRATVVLWPSSLRVRAKRRRQRDLAE